MAQERDWLPPSMHMDLVCGQVLARNEALGPVLHDGEQYYFCSSRCQSHFLRTSKPVRRTIKGVILPFPIEHVVEHERAREVNAY